MYRTFRNPIFDMNPHLMLFMSKHPFLAAISRQVRKVCTRDIPTAGVSYDERRNEVVLWYNDLFMASLTVSRVHGILKHEFYHIVFRHLTTRRRMPQFLWNCGTDMTIDWLIWREAELEANVGPGQLLEPLLAPLPEFAKTPGRMSWIFCSRTYRERPLHLGEVKAQAIPFLKDDHGKWVVDFEADPDLFTTRLPTEMELRAYAFADAIASAPGNMSSEWYFDHLMALFPPDEESGGGSDSGHDESGGGSAGGDDELDGGSLDEHKNWDDVSDELREKIENTIRSMVERAVREADSQSNGWGHTPADICSLIRKSVSTVVDWKALLLHFIGTIARGSSRRTVMARDRKYGLSQPGLVTGNNAHLVIVIDQSGSVSSEMLAEFFAELESCTRKLSVTILPFDSACRVEDAWEWKKGMRPVLNRTKCGGTNFDAPTNVINEHGRALGWEGAVFMTDGECSKPGPCSVKRAWILGRGCSVPVWLDDEIAISMDDTLPASGAWR